jgi:hypothetical protein
MEDQPVRRLILSVTAAAVVLGMVDGPVAARTAPPANIVDIAIAASKARLGEFNPSPAAAARPASRSAPIRPDGGASSFRTLVPDRVDGTRLP